MASAFEGNTLARLSSARIRRRPTSPPVEGREFLGRSSQCGWALYAGAVVRGTSPEQACEPCCDGVAMTVRRWLLSRSKLLKNQQ